MRRSYHSNLAFLDVLFNTLLCFVVLFVITLIFMQREDTSAADVELSAYVIIVASWPGEYDDDVDLYVRDPRGGVVFFRQMNNAVMHLDRDDLGTHYDNPNYDTVDTAVEPENREIVIIRRKIPGEFIVNAHMYNKATDDPIPVRITVYRISPRKEIADTILIFTYRGQEETICRFTIDSGGKILDINDLPYVIAGEILQGGYY